MANDDARKLFMAGLPDSVTEEALRGLFNETGVSVEELTVPRDRTTGRPRGFAFVRLTEEAEAERARQELDGRIVDGKMISVRPFHTDPPVGGSAPRPPRESIPGDRPPRSGPGGGGPQSPPERTLYVGNLPYDTSPEEVDGFLRGLGADGVARVFLPVDPEGRKRGFGFVSMTSAEAANQAIEVLRGADLRGRKLIVNIAHPKGERPARPEGGGPPGVGGDRPVRTFGGPPIGGPGSPPGRSPKGEGRKRKFEDGGGGGGGGGGGAAGRKRDREDDRWRERDDDDW